MVRVERREHLVAQVLGYVAMPAAELEHGALGVLDRPQPQSGEVQRRWPSLGPVTQNRDLLVVELEAGPIDQQLASFRAREREFADPYLGQISPSPEPRELERRIGSRDRDQPRVRRKPSIA